MNEPTDESSRRKGSGFLGVALFLGLALLGYPLSLGPAAWIHSHTSNRFAKNTIEALYWPLEKSTRGTLLQGPLRSYVEYFQ